MEIDLQTLKNALVRAVDDYAALHGSDAVTLDQGLYWTILDDQLFDLGQQPHDLGVGDLEEEFSSVMRRLEENDRLGAVEMQHLAALLTWLSAKAGKAPPNH
jgi:hypothetical protein